MTDNVSVVDYLKYNTEVIQAGLYFQEVVAGLNPDRIPAAAFAAGVVGLAQNIAINGGMEEWNKSTAFADGWESGITGGSTLVVSRIAANESGQYALQGVYTHSAGTAFVRQKVENAADYRGKTISVTARMNPGTSTACYVSLTDGVTTANGTRPAVSAIGNSTATLTVAASAASLTVTIVIDTASVTFSIESVMLTMTAAAQTFIPTPAELDRLRCRRRYQKQNYSLRGTAAAATETLNDYVRIATPMGGTPTASTTAGTRANMNTPVLSSLSSQGASVAATSIAAGDFYSVDDVVSFEWSP